MTYKTKGTCATRITFEVDNNRVIACNFEKGCPGNTQGLSKMVIGRQVEDIIENLSGIQCRNGTSCPDQLANALKEYQNR